MANFDRIYSVSVSPNILIDQLRVKFEIKKTLEAKGNFCKIDIYNLSEQERNKISSEKYALFLFKAGYLQDAGLINLVQGNVTDVIHYVSMPDIITSIYSKDGLKAIKNNFIKLSFAENSSTKNIIDTITNKIGLPIRYSNLQHKNIKGGYSFVGTVSDALDDLGKQYGFTWSIQNGQIQLLVKDSSTNIMAFLLTPETGLIESPNRILKNKEIEKKEKGEYSVTCLLNPQIEVGDLVSIKSNTLNGSFLVKELIHTGDSMGNEWYTKLKISEL